MFEDGDERVIVDSFDNHSFNVRIGTVSNTKHLTTITANTGSELNAKLEKAMALS